MMCNTPYTFSSIYTFVRIKHHEQTVHRLSKMHLCTELFTIYLQLFVMLPFSQKHLARWCELKILIEKPKFEGSFEKINIIFCKFPKAIKC